MRSWVKPFEWAGNVFLAAAVLGVAWQAIHQPGKALIAALGSFAVSWALAKVSAWRERSRTAPGRPVAPETAHKDFDVERWSSDG